MSPTKTRSFPIVLTQQQKSAIWTIDELPSEGSDDLIVMQSSPTGLSLAKVWNTRRRRRTVAAKLRQINQGDVILTSDTIAKRNETQSAVLCYRILCINHSHAVGELQFVPISVLPEQVQCLL